MNRGGGGGKFVVELVVLRVAAATKIESITNKERILRKTFKHILGSVR